MRASGRPRDASPESSRSHREFLVDYSGNNSTACGVSGSRKGVPGSVAANSPQLIYEARREIVLLVARMRFGRYVEGGDPHSLV